MCVGTDVRDNRLELAGCRHFDSVLLLHSMPIGSDIDLTDWNIYQQGMVIHHIDSDSYYYLETTQSPQQ